MNGWHTKHLLSSWLVVRSWTAQTQTIDSLKNLIVRVFRASCCVSKDVLQQINCPQWYLSRHPEPFSIFAKYENCYYLSTSMKDLVWIVSIYGISPFWEEEWTKAVCLGRWGIAVRHIWFEPMELQWCQKERVQDFLGTHLHGHKGLRDHFKATLCRDLYFSVILEPTQVKIQIQVS